MPQLLCHRKQNFSDEMCNSWSVSGYCNTPNETSKINNFDQLNISLYINKTDKVNYKYTIRST